MDEPWELWVLYGVWTIGTSETQTIIDTLEDEEIAQHIVDIHNEWLQNRLLKGES